MDLSTNDSGIHGAQEISDYQLRQVQAISANAQQAMPRLWQVITSANWARYTTCCG